MTTPRALLLLALLSAILIAGYMLSRPHVWDSMPWKPAVDDTSLHRLDGTL